MALQIETSQSQDGYVVKVRGEVDLYSSPQLRAALTENLPRDVRKLGVDLSEVPYMDSSGVATLVEALRTAKAQQATLAILSPSSQVMKVLQLSRLDTVFEIREGS